MVTRRNAVWLVTCEHATARVPPEAAHALRGAGDALSTHKGSDFGAAELARDLGLALGVRPLLGRTTRLAVDLNRPVGHPRLFSEWTRTLPREERDRLVARYHRPHWEAVEQVVAAAAERVIHLGIHSFTPVMNGEVRSTDIGLLYDPARPAERALCDRWIEELRAALPRMRIHRNRPYRGVGAGLTTSLRRRFGDRRYAGIELEVSQSHTLGPPVRFKALRRVIVEVLTGA